MSDPAALLVWLRYELTLSAAIRGGSPRPACPTRYAGSYRDASEYKLSRIGNSCRQMPQLVFQKTRSTGLPRKESRRYSPP